MTQLRDENLLHFSNPHIQNFNIKFHQPEAKLKDYFQLKVRMPVTSYILFYTFINIFI